MTPTLPQKIRHWLQPPPPRDPLLSSDELLRSLNLIVGLDQLLDNLSAKLRETLSIRTVFVVLFEPITNRYIGRKAKGPDEFLLHEFNFSHSDNLIKWLAVNRCALHATAQEEVVKFLSPYEQLILQKTGIVLVLPLIVVNRLTGALFLSERTNQKPYDAGDIEMLSVLTNHTAMAIEHALMYQFQEERLRKLFRSDQLATVGELAAGAAHEIRNPLTAIRSTVQYLKRDLPQAKQALVDGIIGEVDRIDEIIKGLLSLSKTSDLQISRVDIKDLIHQTLALLESELKRHSIVLQKSVELADTTIDADAPQMKQLLLNLFLNSIQAMPHGGTLAYSITDKSRLHGDRSRGEYVHVYIKDTGTGIPADDLSRVFDPFYTTKENGTGLGLSIVYGIATKHGGEIDIQSATEGPDKGTTVTIHLPKKIAHRLGES